LIFVTFDDAEPSGLPKARGKLGQGLVCAVSLHVPVQNVCGNRKAPEEYALPTEIWREAIDRHQRYRAVRTKLSAGEVHRVNDLVTLNLNIRQFAQDVIQFCEGPELLRAVWKRYTTRRCLRTLAWYFDRHVVKLGEWGYPLPHRVESALDKPTRTYIPPVPRLSYGEDVGAGLVQAAKVTSRQETERNRAVARITSFAFGSPSKYSR
jgi:hypothetical protein